MELLLRVRLNPILGGIAYLQANDLFNRGVLDTLGAAVPMIALARNPAERREKTLDRAIVIGSAFFLAPIHAALFLKLLARREKLPSALMSLSYRHLTSINQLKSAALKMATQTPSQAKAIKKLVKNNLPKLRQKIINAKVDMLVPDLITECLIFANVGWLTNIFGKYLTGKKQFTGEMSAVTSNQLDALYKKENAFQKTERLRQAVTIGLAVGVPLALGVALKHALKSSVAKLPPLLRSLRHNARWFDYQKGYWMSMPTLGIVVGMQFIGHLMSARSPRERRENLIRETLLNVVFFWGNDVWHKLISPPVHKAFGLKVQPTLEKMLKATPKNLQQKAAWVGGLSYLTSFLMNSATLAAVVVANNYWTTQKTRADAAKLN